MKGKKKRKRGQKKIESSILDGMRQFWFPEEFRIQPPGLTDDAWKPGHAQVPTPKAMAKPVVPAEVSIANELLAELATLLWYVKTKHFKRDWDDNDPDDQDPRVRRTLGRLYKGITALRRGGVEVIDPTDKRYPPGGENMMRPIQLQPTAGLTVEMVTETVLPIIFRGDRLIQRGDVFVAVPEPPNASQPKDAPRHPLADDNGGEQDSDAVQSVAVAEGGNGLDPIGDVSSPATHAAGLPDRSNREEATADSKERIVKK